MKFEGNDVEVVAVKGGWSEIKLGDGSTRKVRNGSLSATGDAPMAKAKKAKRKSNDNDSRLIKADLTKYVSGPSKTASGRKTIDTDDSTARKLRGLPLGEVLNIAAKKLDVSVQSLKTKYSGLNPGMVRMNLGNRIRGVEAKAAA